MDSINSEILRKFEQQGLCIKDGVAVDVRLVRSASRPLSQDELKKQHEHLETEEEKG
jgi:IS5 family transposase